MVSLDKQAHFYAGLSICLAVSLFSGSITGLVVSVCAGLAKEAYDSLGFGTVDKWDAVATIVGGLLGFVLILISEAL